jgi:hypothetical protein
MVLQLLANPAFHHAVRKVHKKVYEVRHGKDPAEMGGTNIERQSARYDWKVNVR